MKILKYYQHDCLQKFILHFVSSLEALIVKSSHILAGFYFIFLKIVLEQTLKAFNTNLDLSEKIGKVVIK